MRPSPAQGDGLCCFWTDQMRRTGAQILWDTLARQGVTTVFGYPGGAIMPAYDALLESPIRHVLVRHEQGAAHMADGYARASGRVGVAIATSGPGATNLVTGIATAMLDSVPLVCITGQVHSRLIGSDAFQETDITGVTLPITKHNYLVTRAADIAPTIREAFYVARSGRPGPVLVDITKDAQQASVEPAFSDAPIKMRGYRPEHHARNEDLARAAELIDRADITRARRLSGDASAQPRHDGHARRSVGQPRDPGSRPARRARHAVRRSRDRQARHLRAQREEDPLRARSGGDQQERARRRRARRRCEGDARAAATAGRAARAGSVARADQRAQEIGRAHV